MQTEDSVNDLRETRAGILSCFTEEEIRLVRDNLIIASNVAGGDGEALKRLVGSYSNRFRPDLVLVNPLLAFCPEDPTKELDRLLYQTIDPILKELGIGFVGVHHTPKMNNRDTTCYGTHDHQYLAAGDARIANWPRVMIQIEPVASGIYRFRAAKRGRRIGWMWDRQPVSERFFRHDPHAIRWINASPEDAAEAKAGESYTRILDLLPGPGETPLSRERLRSLAKERMDLGKSKVGGWLKLVLEDGTAETIHRTTKSNRTESAFRRTEKAA